MVFKKWFLVFNKSSWYSKHLLDIQQIVLGIQKWFLVFKKLLGIQQIVLGIQKMLLWKYEKQSHCQQNSIFNNDLESSGHVENYKPEHKS